MTIIINATIKDAISQASKATDVSEQMLTAFAKIESNFNINAKSKKTKEGLGGVNGLFQITGDTWKDIWKREGQPNRPYSTKPHDQALAGALYIKWLAPQFQFDQNLIAIAYNAGPDVARELIGKELTEQNIRLAVSKHFKASQIKAKTTEVDAYPRRLAAALGQEYKSSPAPYGYRPGSPEVSDPVDPNKPFFEAMNNKARNSINELFRVIDKLDQGTLRSKIIAHPKLTNLIKTAPESSGS